MCQLVTIGVSQADGSNFREFGGPRDGLAVTPSRNPYLATIFPSTDLRLDVTVGGCSCDLLGGHHGSRLADPANQRRRYEKLGWSRAKIDRALQASTVAHARDHSSEHARSFRSGVLALLDRMPAIRIFVHMYSGDFDNESVPCKGMIQMSRAEYEASYGALPEDTLVEIAAKLRDSTAALSGRFLRKWTGAVF